MDKNLDVVKVAIEKARLDKCCAKIAFQWRNDELTRKMSFNSFHVSWRAFWRQYKTYFDIKDFSPVFITYEDKKIGFVRFEMFDNPYTDKICTSLMIIINIAPEYRGKRVGSTAIKKIVKFFLQKGVDCFFADIKSENIISKKAFINSGFKICEEKNNYKNSFEKTMKISRFVFEE